MDIDKILGSEENPLISVVHLKDPKRIKRGMAFVYKKLSRKVKVIVTCRHTFMADPFEEFDFFLGGNMSPLKVVSPPFYSKTQGHDILFCVVHDDKKHQTIEFNLKSENLKPYDKQILYNSKCDFYPDRLSFPFYVMEQIIYTTKTHWAMSVHNVQGISVNPADEVIQKEFIEKGSVIYHSVGMKTVHGCSGSPIWDSNLNLYGMNVRGIDNQDVLIYVPVSDINKMYKDIESEIMKYKI